MSHQAKPRRPSRCAVRLVVRPWYDKSLNIPLMLALELLGEVVDEAIVEVFSTKVGHWWAVVAPVMALTSKIPPSIVRRDT